METHILSNVPVEFPFKPYPCQLVYMEKVIQSLQQGKNAILESPTGTGKTLCLLCATLAWRQDQIRQLQQRHGGDGVMEAGGEDVDPWDVPSGGVDQGPAIPKIIYASRTHSQLSQVIHELKNTSYRPRVAIIGSREQLCIHPEVSKKETNSEKVHLCRAKVKSHGCHYYNRTDVKVLKGVEPILDVEDLVLTGHRQTMCPYYLARELKSQADIIFMPYNYILDIKTRQMHGVDVQGAVVILDEAHNIERVCEDSASFDLTSGDLAHCITDVQYILDAVTKMESLATAEEGQDDDIADFLNLKKLFLALEHGLDGVVFESEAKREMVKQGDYIFGFFSSAAGLTHSTYNTFVDQCSKAISFLTSDSRSLHKNGNNIQKFLDAAKIVFSQSHDPDGRCGSSYKVFIKSEENVKRRTDMWSAQAQESSKKETRTLSYWCFSPGHTMTELRDHGVRSIVLTSGTLSPLDSFSSELQIDFPIRYEGPHVISERQVWVGVVSKGCDNVPLNSSYANRSNISYQNSLGNTIVNFARIVPHGLLVFFPSYTVMNSCVEQWRGVGIMERIEQHKPVFLEPRRKHDFNPTMDAFYSKVSDPQYGGAAFFAVCRGKVSEGLDFADINGRAVVITGLPYPPRMDPKVTLKMQYLQESIVKTRSSIGLGGEEWYKQQASRAVNQAVGRVIRHRYDYGAIILCDERFAYNSSVSQLPSWVRSYVKTYNKFGVVQRDLNQFFKNAEKEYGGYYSKKVASAELMTAADKETTSSSSLRVPIVIRDPSERGSDERIPEPQNASLVETHIRRKAVPQASLAKLKVESEKESLKKSLLTSLRQCDETVGSSSNLQPIDIGSSSSHHVCQPGPSCSNTECSRSLPLAQSDPLLQSSASSTTAHTKKRIVVSKKEKQTAKMASVAGFINELQDSLSDDAFQRFKMALGLYKKKQDIYVFIESLKDIFNQSSLHHLLQGMYRFVLPEHKATYDLFYREHTGKLLDKSTPILSGTNLKRKASSMSTKEVPKTKALKREEWEPKSLKKFEH